MPPEIRGVRSIIIMSVNIIDMLHRSEALLPKRENNQEAFDALPLTLDRVSSLFDPTSFSRSAEYISNLMKLVSSIQVRIHIIHNSRINGVSDQMVNGQKNYEIHATVPAVSMSGYYNLSILFDISTIKRAQCSCPMVRNCKHLAALMQKICSQKTRV